MVIFLQVVARKLIKGGGTLAGNFLTASYPIDSFTWEARSKDHNLVSPAAITVYAIGVKPRKGENLLVSDIKSITSVTENHPSESVPVIPGYTLTGGGAKLNWVFGSLLTASYPNNDNSWVGAGKDHFVVSPCSITVYAVGVKDPREET